MSGFPVTPYHSQTNTFISTWDQAPFWLHTKHFPQEDRQQEILSFMPRLNAALADFLTEACDEKLTLTAPQMKELFKLGLAAVRQTQRVVSSQDTLRATW